MFKISKRSKHYRKLHKKADRIKREILSHELADKWHLVEVKPYRKKVKIKVCRSTVLEYPQTKEAQIGLKENLDLNKFLGKF